MRKALFQPESSLENLSATVKRTETMRTDLDKQSDIAGTVEQLSVDVRQIKNKIQDNEALQLRIKPVVEAKKIKTDELIKVKDQVDSAKHQIKGMDLFENLQ